MGRAAKLPVYLDANVIIRMFEHRDNVVLRFPNRLQETDTSICKSEMSLAEVLVAPLREEAADLARHHESFPRSGDGVIIVPVDRAVLRRSVELRASFGGKAPDAVHGASAPVSGCKVIVSSGRRLRTPTDIRHIGMEDLDEMGDLP